MGLLVRKWEYSFFLPDVLGWPECPQLCDVLWEGAREGRGPQVGSGSSIWGPDLEPGDHTWRTAFAPFLNRILLLGSPVCVLF